MFSVLLMAAAGGLGWGIRGQYGHETGAMIAGVLMGWVVALLYLQQATNLQVFRVVSMLAIGVSVGGSMTYGQTLGLTQSTEMLGRWDALSWGMLGLAIKGGAWFGFAGLFLGLGLDGLGAREQRLQSSFMKSIVSMFILGLAVYPLGLWLFNSPFDAGGATQPWLYFSESRWWYPDKESFKARPECWGGVWLSLLAMTAYAASFTKSGLPLRMTAWGGLAGGLGFPGGQCIQAYHAWNAQSFASSSWNGWYQHVNWWNMMEMSFGAIAGGVLGIGLWIHQQRIFQAGESRADDVLADESHKRVSLPSGLTPSVELILLATHIVLLLVSTFADVPFLDWYQQYGLVLIILPTVGVALGRYWPYWFPTCIVLLPIAGKSIRVIGYEESFLAAWQAWTMAGLACGAMVALAIWGQSNLAERPRRLWLCKVGLATTVLVYFILNFGFFNFPWPWQEWTTRTPSALLMFAQSGLLWMGCVVVGTAKDKLSSPRVSTPQ